NRVSLRVTLHNFFRSNLIFLLLTAYYLLPTICLHSFPNAVSTIDVRVLEIFHPQELIVTTLSDTFSIQLIDNHLIVNGLKESTFFSKDETTIEIKDKIKRTYRGTLKVYPLINELVIINRVPIDGYLTSVIGAEMGKASFEAQKAQAIVSRTYLFKNLKRHIQYDFCDLTHCQVYKGKESETGASRRAVRETEGIFIWAGNELAEVYYHSTCGGKTANLSSIFEETNESLISVSDSNYCKDSPHYSWDWNLSYEDAPFKELHVLTRSPDGRVTEIKVNGEKESGWKFRMKFAREFGWNKLRSSWFTIEKKETCFHFKGKGLGHGLGMCQWGAKGMAKKGKTAEEILKHYFPKTTIRN
ncbi:SpoIID/LytB domain-containing protein, partial [candidate division WOR-3 bacterium]|nr:SpoIID/LytB domain-containing protein [candidate division WOR-3 bacterium]